MERTLVAFTITLLATASAHASHPRQSIRAEGSAAELEFVATGVNSSGKTFARQVLAARGETGRAVSRIIYLNRDGAILFPGDSDSTNDESSIVAQPTLIPPWDVDDDTWAEVFDCVKDLYSRFDVEITDDDPGDAPHIEAVFGGHPGDVGLEDNVAGVSPFTTDCSVIEHSVVFTFTDVLEGQSARTICEVMAQEIAHSYGLDHEMLRSDPMTYLDYSGDRSFQDQMASCGEFGSRQCGINGSVCRDRQNSVALLESRLGRRGAEDDPPEDLTTTTGPEVSGCAASGSGAPLVVGLAVLGLRRRRRRR